MKRFKKTLSNIVQKKGHSLQIIFRDFYTYMNEYNTSEKNKINNKTNGLTFENGPLPEGLNDLN